MRSAHLASGGFQLTERPVWSVSLRWRLWLALSVLGDRCQLGCNSVTDPGTFLAPNTHAYPLSRLRAGVYGPGEILKPRQVVERAPLLQ